MEQAFIGIDVQEKRGCCFAVIGSDGALLSSGWFRNPEADVVRLTSLLGQNYDVAVGIDAPRQPLPAPRKWFWNGRSIKWEKRSDRRGHGRHCEIILSAHRIANPQYTPTENDAPGWIVIGFKLFSALGAFNARVHEVFPSASYHLLKGVKDVRISIDFSSCRHGPKDILDAFVAAATVREFVHGRGCEVGGGDGLGTIILPRPMPEPVIKDVLHWPEK